MTKMKTTRRKFIGTALAGSPWPASKWPAMAAAVPVSSCSSDALIKGESPVATNYRKLDAILKQPVFRKEFFPDPVIIESLELLRFKDNFLCRVRSKRATPVTLSDLCISSSTLFYKQGCTRTRPYS